MKIEIEISLSDDEKSQLANIIDCEEEELDDKLVSYCEAAAREHIKMYLGQRVFTRGSDFKEYRLFLLIQHAFQNKIPSEQTISNLFQTTITQSRSLVRSVMSKYQYEISDAIKYSITRVLEDATQNEEEEAERYYVTIGNKSIVDTINQTLGTIDGTLPQIKKKTNSVSTYVIEASSYTNLNEYFA